MAAPGMIHVHMDKDTSEVLKYLAASNAFPRLKDRPVAFIVHDFVQSHPDYRQAQQEMARRPVKK